MGYVLLLPWFFRAGCLLVNHGEKAAPTEFLFLLLTIFSNFSCSAFLFQVTCITDEGSAMTPVIKYNAGEGVGK